MRGSNPWGTIAGHLAAVSLSTRTAAPHLLNIDSNIHVWAHNCTRACNPLEDHAIRFSLRDFRHAGRRSRDIGLDCRARARAAAAPRRSCPRRCFFSIL